MRHRVDKEKERHAAPGNSCILSDSCLRRPSGSDQVTKKLVNGSRVGQVGPTDSCGHARDLDQSLVNSRNLSQVGQVRPDDSCGQVGNIDPSGSK